MQNRQSQIDNTQFAQGNYTGTSISFYLMVKKHGENNRYMITHICTKKYSKKNQEARGAKNINCLTFHLRNISKLHINVDVQ